MKKAILAIMGAVMLFGMVATSQADPGDWRGGIRSRIHEAEARIERGIERGSLTRHEADRLNRELNHILNRIDRMRDDDGHLDRREREIINRDLDRLDYDITREKRDGDRRDWDRRGDRQDWDGVTRYR